MSQTLLQEAILSLTPSERREFDKFVRSPFFNTRQALVERWEAFEQALFPEIPDVTRGIPDILKKSQPVEERLLHSALLVLLEKYLAYKEKFQDDDRAMIRLAAAYRKRGLTRHFKISLREARQNRERQIWRHADHYHDLHLIEWEQYQQEVAERRTESLNLQASSDSMDLAFIARKLRLACLAISHQAVFRTDYELGLLSAILAHVEKNNLLEIPAIGLYYYCYKLLIDTTQNADFERFKTMLNSSADQFPTDEQRLLYLLAINYGIRQINLSAEGWVQETLALYKGALERELLLEHGIFSRFAFSNIVAIALRAGENEWAGAFIEQHKKYLERQWRDATASLCTARVAYARKDYATALLHLQKSDYKDTMNNLAAKTLQLKIYFETTEFDLLENHLKSLKNYIRRHAAIGYHRTNYSRLVYYTEQLMSLNILDRKSVRTLREQLQKETVLTEKDWLLSMLNG